MLSDRIMQERHSMCDILLDSVIGLISLVWSFLFIVLSFTFLNTFASELCKINSPFPKNYENDMSHKKRHKDFIMMSKEVFKLLLAK